MKVGLFIDTWYPMVDGVIKVVDNYARRLVKYCDVTVFCPADGIKTPKIFGTKEDKPEENYPYKLVRCNSFPLPNIDYNLPAGGLDPEFDRLLRESKLDLVHIHSPFSVCAAGVIFAKIHHIPVIATLHSQYRQDFETSLKLKSFQNIAMAAVMKTFNACDQCWAVNGSIKELYINEYGLAAPCKVRLNGTDHMPVENPQEAAAEVNKAWNIPEDATVLLFIGRINFLKNIDFIVRALAIAKKKGLGNFRMLFVGRGQDEEKLAQVIKEQGMEDEVIMCGLVKERSMLEKIYSRAKLFLFPSLYDANSLVQIEAACQSTPTLFLRNARTAGTVTENVNGYLSDPNEESYADKILEILANEEGYEQVSKAARRDLYIHWDDVVREVFDEYTHCLRIQ